MRIEKGFPVGPDGRVHSTFNWNASTLRGASSNPNLYNIPRVGGENDPARWVKDCFVAPPGWTFAARDFSAIEAVLVGYFAGSARYIKAAKLGVHAFLASHIIKEPAEFSWPEDKLRAHFKYIKSAHKPSYETAKRVVHGCVPGDHEVLTPNGWVRFDSLADGTPVAQWDCGVISFAAPKVLRKEYAGSMIAVQGRGLSATMTPDHRVPVNVDSRSEGVKEHRAATLLSATTGRIPVVGMLRGGLPGEAVWIRLAVAVQADACRPSGAIFHLVKARKQQRLIELCNAAGITPKVVPCACHPGRGVRISIPKADLTPINRWLPEGRKKIFSLSALLAASLDLRQAFLDEIPHWDGAHSLGKSGRQTNYFTTNLQNAETVQTIAHVSGRQALLRPARGCRARQRPGYVLSFNHRGYAAVEALDRWVEAFSGMVYCVTVPSGWFLIRHRGRVSVTGNSNYLGTPRHLHDIFPETFPTIKSIATLQGMYFDLFPEIPQWHRDLCLRVDAARMRKADPGDPNRPDPWTLGVAYAQNPFGYVHRFYHVLDWQKVGAEWVWSLGDDAKRLIAFLPQSTAAAIIKRAARILWEEYPWVGEHIRLLIHDEIFFECPEGEAEGVLDLSRQIMEAPIPELPLDPAWGLGECLSIGSEGKRGNVWSMMQ